MDASKNMDNCHLKQTVSNEQFIAEHIFTYIVSGSVTIYDGNKEYHIAAGAYSLVRRNRLARYIKQPPAGGQFKTISIFFKQPLLKSFSGEYDYTADGVVNHDTVIKIQADTLLESCTQSLASYLNLTGAGYENLFVLKQKEIMLLLLKTNPDLKNVLFDFSDPGKIDLEAFMNRNFRFNVSLDRFAYLTGRSLTAFKRDFERVFNNAPGRWLVEKRLQEAHYLIEKKGEKPSAVYLEVGFEDLSHFSFAFKKVYGVSPSQLGKTGK